MQATRSCSHRPRPRRAHCSLAQANYSAWCSRHRTRGHLINRYYDPTTAQFLSIDPLAAMTGQPYQYAGDDPVNASDPSGLCRICSAWDATGGAVIHAQVSLADTARHDTAAAGDWVANHPEIAAGIGLGALAVVTGGVGIAALAGYVSVSAGLVGAVSVAAGTGAALLDYSGCFGSGTDQTTKTVACVGFGSGLVGAAFGAIPLVAPESAFALQFGIYGLAFGAAANFLDIVNAFLTSASCKK